jgi:hypothetical protein
LIAVGTVVRHPRIYKPPTPIKDTLQQVDHWLECPTLRLLGEEPGYRECVKALLLSGKAAGPLVHDARIAAICKARGVQELWAADKDYSRFPGLSVRNPLAVPRPLTA